jgi:hypothetical protein
LLTPGGKVAAGVTSINGKFGKNVATTFTNTTLSIVNIFAKFSFFRNSANGIISGLGEDDL